MVTKVAVGCGGCGQQGRIDLERVSDRLKCRCGSVDVDLLERRRDVRGRFISTAALKTAAHSTYEWDPDPVGEAWRAPTPSGHFLIVEPDLTTGFFGVVEDRQGNVLYQQVMSTANLDEAKGHLEVAYAETFLVPHNERQTEQAVFGSKTAETTCPRCGGTGNLPEGDGNEGTTKCPRCDGSGRVTARRRDVRTSTLHQRIVEDIRTSNPKVSMGRAASLARRVEQTYLRRAR